MVLLGSSRLTNDNYVGVRRYTAYWMRFGGRRRASRYCGRGECDSSRRDATGRMLPWFEDDLDRTSRGSDSSIFPSL